MRVRLLMTVAIISVFAAFTYWAYDSSKLYLFQTGIGNSETYNLLFDTAIIGIPVALFVGIFLGSLNYKKTVEKFVDGEVERHDELFFLQHWSNALGIITLIVTGLLLGTLFIPRMIHSVEQVAFLLNMHYVGILFFFFGASYYVTKAVLSGEFRKMLPRKGDLTKMIGHYKAMLTRSEAPKEEKFIAAERVVFPLWIVGLLGIAFTGIMKTLAHVWSFPGALTATMTFLHGVFAIFLTLLLAGHIFAAAILSWPMLRSMLTGKMKEEHVKKNHQIWYEEIKAQEKELEQELDKAN